MAFRQRASADGGKRESAGPIREAVAILGETLAMGPEFSGMDRFRKWCGELDGGVDLARLRSVCAWFAERKLENPRVTPAIYDVQRRYEEQAGIGQAAAEYPDCPVCANLGVGLVVLAGADAFSMRMVPTDSRPEAFERATTAVFDCHCPRGQASNEKRNRAYRWSYERRRDRWRSHVWTGGPHSGAYAFAEAVRQAAAKRRGRVAVGDGGGRAGEDGGQDEFAGDGSIDAHTATEAVGGHFAKGTRLRTVAALAEAEPMDKARRVDAVRDANEQEEAWT